MKRPAALILGILLLLAAAGCGSKDTAPGLFLSSIVNIDLSGAGGAVAKREIMNFLKDFEEAVAVDLPGSDVARINRAAAGETVSVSNDTRENLEIASRVYTATDKAFDVALFPLSELWGFSPANEGHYSDPRPEPSAESIASTLPYSSLDAFVISGNTVVKKYDEAKIDLGGIAKGYAMDRSVEIAKKHGVTRGSISMGSSMSLIGEKENGAPYNVGIRDPRNYLWSDFNNYFAAVRVKNTSVAVSGDYERYYEYNGRRYCHILSGATGRPVSTGVISVCVLGASSAVADAYATAAFVLGDKRAAELFEKEGISGIIIFEREGRYYYRVTGQVELLPDLFDSGNGSAGVDGNAVYKEYHRWTDAEN